MKLLIRGGSIAAGFGVIKSYVDILTQSLLGKGIEVINRSRYQETTFDGIGTFYEDIDNFRPDILLIQFGVDDAFGYVYRSEFQENIVQMIRLARLRFHPVIVLATSHTFDDPHDMDAVNIFYRSLRIVATELGCELIPVHSYWAGYLAEHNLSIKDLVLSDSRHPNERGHQVIAEAMMKWLEIIDISPVLSVNDPPVFKDVIENGYHIFSFNQVKTPGFYPNKFPDYPGVKLSSLVVGDRIIIRAFFCIGSGKPLQFDSGLIDLEVELIETDHIFGVIVTKLPAHFPLVTGSSLEIMEDEILYKVGVTVH